MLIQDRLIARVGDWPARGGATVLVDRSGRLGPIVDGLPEHPRPETAEGLTPSRRAETDLPPALAATTAAADPVQVRAALREAWHQGHDLWVRLALRHGFAVPEQLVAAIDREI